ncbi:hypothetical protein QBC42DRAFT_265697 [Cladorrhinum samala]|uniref:Uncharacterized protein n=1 Tax=Cladorrhinum samala TaxID=585594 RepID=A0AAV9HVH2_9PEZI|nr:hypothetical protein QBC42DRAFT_265697 [Cladorrhinum samala]
MTLGDPTVHMHTVLTLVVFGFIFFYFFLTTYHSVTINSISTQHQLWAFQHSSFFFYFPLITTWGLFLMAPSRELYYGTFYTFRYFRLPRPPPHLCLPSKSFRSFSYRRPIAEQRMTRKGVRVLVLFMRTRICGVVSFFFDISNKYP